MAIADPDATDLLDNPLIQRAGSPLDGSETPFDKAVGLLSVTEGEHLEIMMRTNPRIVEAANIMQSIDSAFHSRYVKEKMERMMRFSISMDGRGRTEIVQALSAGSGVPGEYYESKGATKEFTFSESDD